MNYYPFHVGDYMAHTAHLDPIEDIAYRRLLDLYYLREQPIPSDTAEAARRIRMKGHAAEVEAVLSEFFTLTDDGWRNERCDSEISKMQDKQAKARASAEASVRARANGRSANAQPTLSERSANVELPTPTPIPKEEKISSSSSATPDADPAVGKTAGSSERLAVVTSEAIDAYNATLAKPKGLLPAVTRAGAEKRRQQVKRCLNVARDICTDQFDEPKITPEFWQSYFETARADDFHSGRQGGGKAHPNWLPDFEFLTRPDVMLKLYDRAAGAAE